MQLCSPFSLAKLKWCQLSRLNTDLPSLPYRVSHSPQLMAHALLFVYIIISVFTLSTLIYTKFFLLTIAVLRSALNSITVWAGGRG